MSAHRLPSQSVASASRERVEQPQQGAGKTFVSRQTVRSVACLWAGISAVMIAIGFDSLYLLPSMPLEGCLIVGLPFSVWMLGQVTVVGGTFFVRDGAMQRLSKIAGIYWILSILAAFTYFAVVQAPFEETSWWAQSRTWVFLSLVLVSGMSFYTWQTLGRPVEPNADPLD